MGERTEMRQGEIGANGGVPRHRVLARIVANSTFTP